MMYSPGSENIKTVRDVLQFAAEFEREYGAQPKRIYTTIENFVTLSFAYKIPVPGEKVYVAGIEIRPSP